MKILRNHQGGPWPETYLHVTECRSGETWTCPLRGNALLDLKTQVKNWIKQEIDSDCLYAALDGEIMPRVEGDYYARIMTDGREPDSIVCWEGGGFYIKTSEYH
jgi:hypothetical protein